MPYFDTNKKAYYCGKIYRIKGLYCPKNFFIFLEQQMKFVFAVGSSRFVSPVGFGGDSSPEVLII